jgi:hypothetical protein
LAFFRREFRSRLGGDLAWWVGRRVVANSGPTLDLIVTSLLSAWRSGMARSRVELFEQIRRDWRAGGSSIRELAVRHHVHRRTVRQALASAVPPPRKAYPPRPRPAIGPYAEVIDGWLLADREVPRKQRHTACRIWQRLVAEHGAGLAEVTVSRYVARRRAELGLDTVQVTVPQAHARGAEAEVDFGEFHAVIAGGAGQAVDVRDAAVVLGPGAFHVAFATQAQEAFLEGHVRAFEYFGAVPGRVRYENVPRNIFIDQDDRPAELLMRGVQQARIVSLGEALVAVLAGSAVDVRAVDQPGPPGGAGPGGDQRGYRDALAADGGHLHHRGAAAAAPGASLRRLRPWPDSSSKQSQAPRSAAVLL